MEPFYRDEALTVWQGDCRAVLATLPAESVHAVVTSPPYWGLRDYGIEPGVWGGDPGHGHEWDDALVSRKDSATGKTRWNHATNGQGRVESELVVDRRESVLGSFCSCGAWRGALGLEPSVDLYVEHLVDVLIDVNGAYLVQAMERNRQLGLFLPPETVVFSKADADAIVSAPPWGEATGDA